MSDEKISPEELKRIEADLAGLVPRRDQLDPRWRDFLAKAADLNAGESVDHAACSAPGDHLFLCVYCGASWPRASRVRRWAWPAAFSVMTAVAAVLLAMLAVRPQFQPIHHVVKTAEGDSPIFPAEKLGQSPSPSESKSAWASYSGPRWREERLCRLAATDSQLFDQALSEYFHQPPVRDSMLAANHSRSESIPTARELMDEMLKRAN